MKTIYSIGLDIGLATTGILETDVKNKGQHSLVVNQLIDKHEWFDDT